MNDYVNRSGKTLDAGAAIYWHGALERPSDEHRRAIVSVSDDGRVAVASWMRDNDHWDVEFYTNIAAALTKSHNKFREMTSYRLPTSIEQTHQPD